MGTAKQVSCVEYDAVQDDDGSIVAAQVNALSPVILYSEIRRLRQVVRGLKCDIGTMVSIMALMTAFMVAGFGLTFWMLYR